MAESEKPKKRRALLAEYGQKFGVDVRTVKRWKALGAERNDPAPLEDAERMLSWWQRNMKQRVPDGISAAVISARREQPAELARVVEEPALKKNRAAVDAPVDASELGLDQTLQRLAETEVRLSRIATDPGQTKAWLDTVARMTSAAEKVRQEMERHGKLIPRERAEVLVHDFHLPIEREIRLLCRAMAEALGLPQTPALEERWNRECDRVFARLGEEVFR